MASTFECPKCGRELKVPDELLGKKVKCPACQSIFITAAEPAAPPPVAPPSEEVTSRSVSGLLQEPAAEEPPRKRPRRWEDDYEEEDYSRSRSRLRRAQSAVAGPAISLIVVGGLALGLGLVSLILNILGVALISSMPDQPIAQQGSPQLTPTWRHGLGIFGAGLGICWGSIVLLGAVWMKNLRSYAMAMTSCIVGMLPCNICCLFGLPFGIWGIVVINQPDVKQAFRS
jgi:hypothetical protein